MRRLKPAIGLQKSVKEEEEEEDIDSILNMWKNHFCSY
jgi:hypothetical protein